jgi:TRAP-type C4-dicarboxylate transport system permease small subunit
MAILYAPGAIFALMAGFILLTNLWLALTGQLSKADLVMVQASEEAAQLEEILGAAQQVQNDARPGGAIK